MQYPETTQRYRLDYRAILEFRVLHRYYTSGSCRDLDIRPTPETAAKLRGYQIVFRKEADGFLLAINSQRDYSAPLFSRPDAFDFAFRVPNPQFIRFTDLPFESSQFHVFQSSGGSEGRMHPGEFVDGSSIQPSDTDGVTGLIRILQDADQPLIPASADQAPETPRLHYLHFGARKARIRYVFYGAGDLLKNFDEYSLESFEINGKPLTFIDPRQKSLRNGDEAFEIVSREEVEIQVTYDGHGLLKKARGAGNPFLYKKVLPLPKPENVSFDPIDKQYYADIFVKL
jgi:hypothetical protein